MFHISSAALADDWVSPSSAKKILAIALGEMMAASQYPSINFESASATRVRDAECRVAGELEIRGMKKRCEVEVIMRAIPDGRLNFSGNARVRSSDCGLRPPSAILGLIGTKNEMRIEFSLSAAPSR